MLKTVAWSKFVEALRIASYVLRDRVAERKLLIMGNARRRGSLALLLAGVLTAGTSWGAAGAAVPAQLTTAGPTVGDDPSDAPPSTRGAQRRSSRMATSAVGETTTSQDQDGSTVYRVDDGFDLDQYLCRDASPLDWSMDLTVDYGPVDADGHPVSGNKLFGKTVKLTMNVYDVDEASGEVDHLYVNGTKVGGNLTGANNQWATNTIEVPSEVLEFPHAGNATGTNQFSVDIDTTNAGWCVEVGWAELRPGITPVLPMAFVHGIASTGAAMDSAERYFTEAYGELAGLTVKPNTTRTGGIILNAQLLDSEIDRALSSRRLDIFAHSKGGLDSRLYAALHPGRVRNLVMAGTPNGGSELADWLCAARSQKSWAGYEYPEFGNCDDDTDALYSLRTEYVRDVFNRVVSDSTDTNYFTIAGAEPYTGGKGNTKWIVPSPHDGAVSVNSVRWLDRDEPGSGLTGGRHVTLNSGLDENHDELIGSGSLSYVLAERAMLGRDSTNAGGALSSPTGSGLTQRAVIGSPAATPARSINGLVAAGETARFALDVGSNEPALLQVVGDPGVEFAVGTASEEATSLMGARASQFSFTGPQDLVVRNTGSSEGGFEAYLLVESARTLSLDVPAIAGQDEDIPLSATVTNPQPGEAVEYAVTDEAGKEVAGGTMTSAGAGTFSTTVSLEEVGSYSVGAWTVGSGRRVAGAPLQIAGGGEVGPGFSESLVDDDGDGRADVLQIEVPVDVEEPGTYLLGAQIIDSSGTPVADGQSDATEVTPSSGGVMTLSFDGKQLGNSGAPGPWSLGNLVLSDSELSVKATEAGLGELTYGATNWYEYDAVVLGQFSDSTRDEDGDGTLDFLDIGFNADVAFDDSYAVNGKLVAEDGTEIARAQDVLSFDKGGNTGRLSFSAADIEAAGKSGRFILRDFQIYPQSDQSSSMSLVDAHTTKSYNAEDLTESTGGGGGGGALEPTGSVVVSGTPEVGQTLTVTAEPTWSAPSTVTTQWLRDGEPITGATSSSYVLTADDEGHDITALLTASAQGYDNGYAESDAVSVGQGVLERTGEVTIDGTPRVGRQLTAGELPTWTPSADLTFQWLRNGSPITGATSRAYTLVPADREQQIALQVTAEADGFGDDVATSDPVTIGLGQLQRTGVLTMLGTPTVGQTLSVDRTPSYTPSATVDYQWLRDGEPITGATGTSYTVTSADIGSAVAVRQIASREKYEDYVVDSDPQVVAARVIEGEGVPTLSGTPALGSTLTATAPTWSVDGSTVDYAFAWFRDGVAIPGATDETYTVTFDDVGADLTVQVTGTADGAPDRVATSETSTVSKVKPVVAVTATPGKGRVSLASTLSAVGVPKRLITGEVIVKRGRTEIGSGEVRRGRSIVVLTGQRAGTRTYKVLFVATDTFKRARQVVTTRIR